ncbi:class I SAM-dependent methyltransferase [Ferrovibrio sp.]|uniref:class I SAM-dependent methyltransferase n=1 Tax=Ferrovibrio sp. TaxID=1917215 RepID=UPI0035AE53CE
MVDAVDSKILKLLDALSLSGYEDGYARTEFSRGAAYHHRRIEMLGVSGARALDAGCGVGNWSLALSQFFDEVHALELSETRLSIVSEISKQIVPNIKPVVGNVEKLDFPDGHFDAVFCIGVIFLVNVEQALAEFRRVLKPNGKLYVTYNAAGWWRYLMEVRGKAEPNCVTFGGDAFIDRAYRLLQSADRDAILAAPNRKKSWRAMLEGLFASRPVDLDQARLWLRDDTALGKELIRSVDVVLAAGNVKQKQELAVVLRDFRDGKALQRPSGRARLIDPSDMQMLMEQAGFSDIRTDLEGTLGRGSQDPEPIYTAAQGVCETLARRI